MMKLPGVIYRFDGAKLDPSNLQLTVAGEKRALEPKSLRLLAFLVENRGQVVTKEEILSAVWGGTPVTDNALTRAVAQIRRALADDPKAPRFIETIPTVGYRFIGQLSEEQEPAPIKPDRVSHLLPGRLALLGVVALVAAAALAWTLRIKSESVAGAPGPVPLTSYRGNEESPSFSPDGNQVAFSWNGDKQDNFDIYVKALGADSRPVRLTSDPSPDLWPKWSPDGRSIAFRRVRTPDRVYLMLIPALGGPERTLAEFPYRNPSSGFNPAWSADSRWLIFPAQVGERIALYCVSVETAEVTRISEPEGVLGDGFPSISPDGKVLMFTRRPPFNWGVLYQVPIDQNARPIGLPHRVATGGSPVAEAHWTADGKEILARIMKAIVRMPTAGSDHPLPIPWLGSAGGGFDFSRRGNRMAFSAVRGDANVWRIDLTARVPQPERLIASTFRDVYPHYSPDGRRLAFYSSRSGTTQVWVGNAEGADARQLTFVKPGQAATPNWSPDGRTLAIDSNTTGLSQIYTVSVDGGKMKQLTQGPPPNFCTTWSRDGRWMYFTSGRTGRNEIWKMPNGGGTPIQVTFNGGVKALESEDGKTLYFSKDSADGSIWKMPVSGGPEEQLASSLFRINFALAKHGVYYMANVAEDGTTSLKFYSFHTGATTTIVPIGRPEFGLDVSPDERYLVYAQLDDPASDLMLVENFR